MPVAPLAQPIRSLSPSLDAFPTTNDAAPVPGTENEDDDDRDAPPETISLRSGKDTAMENIRLVKEVDIETGQKRRTANRLHDSEVKARKAEEARLANLQKRKAERNFAKKLKKQAKLHGGRGQETMIPHSSDTVSSDHVLNSPAEDVGRTSTSGFTAEGNTEMGQPGDDDREASSPAGTDDSNWGGVDSDEAQDPERPASAITSNASVESLHHLPEAIFSAAAQNVGLRDARASDVLPRKVKDNEPAVWPDHRRRKRSFAGKDTIVGSRVIRPLKMAAEVGAESSLRPSKKTRAFVRQRMNTKGEDNGRQWQRMSGHLAFSARALGPAKGFATSR